MRDVEALKGILGILTVWAVALLLLGVLVSQEITTFITPPPENVAEGFVSALGAHRYEGAMNQLSQDLKEQVTQQDLQNLVEQIEESQQGIEQAQGQSSEEQQEQATAQVKVKTGNLQEYTLEFQLKKEKGIWKLDSIDPLQSLVG